jgi:HEAT repeat protein
VTFYCPGCWREVPEPSEHCPLCGYDLAAHEHLPYEEKLIAALAHPIRENRVFAIHALGSLRSHRALPHFARILGEDQDYYVLRETLVALSRLNTTESRALILGATSHPSTLVRTFARELVGRAPIVSHEAH